jgi:hypothetical protein
MPVPVAPGLTALSPLTSSLLDLATLELIVNHKVKNMFGNQVGLYQKLLVKSAF